MHTNTSTIHIRHRTHFEGLNDCPPIQALITHIRRTFIFDTQVHRSCISVLFTPITPPFLCLSLSPRTVSIGRFLFLSGLPRPLINPTNSKGYINVDNQFLYVSSQSLEKKIRKKIKTVLFDCANVFFLTIFNVITSSNLILLPLLQLVLKYA